MLGIIRKRWRSCVLKKVICILIVVLLIFALAAGAGYGFAWYRSSHVFVDGDAYPISVQSIDLREKDVSLEYVSQLKAQLPGCQISWMVPFRDGKIDSGAQSLNLGSFTREEAAYVTAHLPQLKAVDASQSRDYETIAWFQETYPDIDITYQVDLGGKVVDPETVSLELNVGEYDYETLTANIPYLRDLGEIVLHTPELTTQQVADLRAGYPEIAISCTVEILGTEYDDKTTELNLSSLKSEDVPAVAEKLPELKNLTSVELMGGSGNLSKEDVKTLIAAAPGAGFHYTFDFFGQTLSTDTEEVVLKNVKIGDENEAEVRSALDLLPGCKRMVLDNCHLSNEVLAKIREDYREQTKVVWRVWFGKGSCLTDAQAIRAVYDLVDSNCQDLIYCEDVRIIDFGHNEMLNTCEFVAGMKSLEYIILSGSPIKDLTPFENCKNLKFLELTFCGYIADLTPLASCSQLAQLNISNTKVTDLSPLDELPMEHLTLVDSKVSAAEKQRFAALKPDCLIKDSGNQYGCGWRYVDEANTKKMSYYALLSDVFGYPEGGSFNHSGIYTEKTEEDYKD